MPHPSPSPAPRVAVVGGGVAGLAAAWQLSTGMPGARLILLESAARTGGKLRAAEVGGHVVDVGAESMLARRPEGLELAGQVGLAGRVEHPVTTQAAVWSRGALHRLPGGTLMGVPARPEDVFGLLTAEEVARLRAVRPDGVELTGDVTVGDYLAARLGPAVVDRLVDPLLGGVYAGHARHLSLQATVPALWLAATLGVDPAQAAREAAAAADDGSPVFAGITGGLHRLAGAVTARLLDRGVEVLTSAPVTALTRTRAGWSVEVGAGAGRAAYEVDAVVLALPARPAARLLSSVQPAAAEALGGIEYASLAVVTYAFPRRAMPPLAGSGVLVPAVEGLAVKAATFSSNKWAWLAAAAPELSFLRVSVGRHREERVLQRPDGELVEVGLADLRSVLGAELPAPVDAHVQRWGGGLPQYAVGHVDRVAGVRAALAGLPGLAVCGAAYDGVGVPACVASGRAAAQAVLTGLRGRAAGPGERAGAGPGERPGERAGD